MRLSPATRTLVAASAATLGIGLALSLAGQPGLATIAIVLAVALVLTILAHLLRRETRR